MRRGADSKKLKEGMAMKYTVEVGYESFVGGYIIPNCSKKEAEKFAREEARKNPDQNVFVSWFRSSDGQKGYLNSDGNYEITGKAW